MPGGVLGRQQALDLQGRHVHAWLAPLGRDRDTTDAAAPDNCQQGQICAIEQWPELLANDVQQIALGQVLAEERVQITLPAPWFITHRHGQADEIGRIGVRQILQDVLVTLAIELSDGLAANLNIELHAESPRRCSARMSSTVRACPAFTSFRS